MSAVALSATSLASDANLKHYYPFDGNSTDSKGTASGADTTITYGSSFGLFSQGAEGTATSSKILMTSGITTDLGNQFSISVWFYPTANPGVTGDGNYHFCQSWVTVGYTNYWVDFGIEGGTNKIYGNLFNNATNPYVHTASAITLNAWHNAIITRDHAATKFHLYVDGAEAGTSNVTDTTTTPTYNDFTWLNLHAANAYDSGAFYLDDGSIFNRALSSSEASTIWGGGPAVASNPTSPFLTLGVG